jgi:hypothetical protein
MYKPFTELDVGFTNAENYQRRENRELFQRYFVRDDYLEKILDSNVFYVIGEKGTGKTAYATFLSNNNFHRHNALIFDVRQTEYQKFLELKKAGHLPLSGYSDVWYSILLFLLATQILESPQHLKLLSRNNALRALKKAIDDFYSGSFAPEIVRVIDFIESGELSSALLAKHMGIGGEIKSSGKLEQRSSLSVFQTNLLKIRRALEAAIRAVRTDEHFIVFIDGIDVRPADIEYNDYFECVRGLIEAIWSVNNSFLANLKDVAGTIRVVLLVRPDTFLRTGLHNLNTKLRDNSVFLNWSTTYKDYRTSLLFKIADRLLSAQQELSVARRPGDAWDHYFPFHAENVKADSVSGEHGVNSFLAFIRFSYYRPRDITSLIGTIQEIVRKKKGHAEYVTSDDFDDPSFRDAHAEYLLGEIRDQLLFYYSQDEYDLFLQFFSHLRGKRKFSYAEFLEAFNEFVIECDVAGKKLPQFFENANVFLQFLYEQNVISYKERGEDISDSEVFIRWCFRERTLANMAPKVRVGVDYEIFYGLSKALNVGKRVRVRAHRAEREVGTIISVNSEKGFGFIRGGAAQTEFYFKLAQFYDRYGRGPRVSQKVSFIVDVKYAKPRAKDVTPQK